MTDVPTDVRATVRLLLRGLPTADGAQRAIEGYTVLLIGQATARNWPTAQVLVGDLEGVVWTTPRQVDSVVRNLRASPYVVEAVGVG